MTFKAIKICAGLNTGLKIIVIIKSFELEVKANSGLKEKRWILLLQLMCKSLIMMFKGMHPDKMEGCNFDCKIPAKEEEEGTDEENAVSTIIDFIEKNGILND